MTPEAFAKWQARVRQTRLELDKVVARPPAPPRPPPRPPKVVAPKVVAPPPPASPPRPPPPPLPELGRAETLSVKVMARQARALSREPKPVDALAAEELAPLPPRPRTRGECCDGPRPCGFVGCRHHLYLDVNPATGSIKINYPGVGPEQLPESCSLDVADQGGVILDKVGQLMNVTRERARQMEVKALAAAAARMPAEKRWQFQCKTLDADTGLRCGLMEHREDTPHRSPRGEFRRALVPGEQPRRGGPDAWHQAGSNLDGVA